MQPLFAKAGSESRFERCVFYNLVPKALPQFATANPSRDGLALECAFGETNPDEAQQAADAAKNWKLKCPMPNVEHPTPNRQDNLA